MNLTLVCSIVKISIEYHTKEKVEQILNSWKGHADHACSKNFYSYLENRFDYIYRNQNGSFKIKNLKEAV